MGLFALGFKHQNLVFELSEPSFEGGLGGDDLKKVMFESASEVWVLERRGRESVKQELFGGVGIVVVVLLHFC